MIKLVEIDEMINVNLLAIYDKSETAAISDKEIIDLIQAFNAK